MSWSRFLCIIASAVVVLTLSSCGDDETPEPTASEAGGGGQGGRSSGDLQILQITAEPDGSLAYTEDELTIPAGDVIVEFENPSPIQHDVAFNDPAGRLIDKTEIVTNSSTTIQLDNLQPGSYRYWCSVPGHLEAGMEGTLTVE